MIKMITLIVFILTLNSCATYEKPSTITPTIAPVPTPKIQQKGTMGCSKKKVYNKTSGKYEWRTICF